jgi:lipopolysaccharide transport protein LptA
MSNANAALIRRKSLPAVSPSAYLIAIPLGVIAISSWLVKIEGDSFSTGRRTSSIQQVARHPGGGAAQSSSQTVEAQSRLDHDRYGWETGQTTGGALLGVDPSHRPMGERPMAAAVRIENYAVNAAAALPPIPGVIETPPPAEPFFETVPADSGFHIAADEATKLDMGQQTVTFNGHVKLASPQFHLTASKLVVHLGKDKKSFRLLEATGSVDVQLTGVPDEKKYRGQSGVAVYDPGKGTLTLTGWPKIQGSGQELVAAEQSTKVILVPKTGKMLTEGRAQTRVAKRLMEEGTSP